MRVRALCSFHAGAILSLIGTFVGADDPNATDVRIYEVIELTIDLSKPTYTSPPCEGCLDESGALQAAGKYLYEIGIVYEALRTERWDGFQWCGTNTEEVVKTEMGGRFTSDATIHDYFRDDVLYHLRTPTGDQRAEQCASETWRVWYQTGWLEREQAEPMVTIGLFSTDVLAANVPLEKSFLIHARTGLIGGVGHLEDLEQRQKDPAARQRVADWVTNQLALQEEER